MWISLLIVAYRRKHSDSQSEQAIPASGGRPAEIERIMEDEENRTTLLRWEYNPAAGGTQTPTSGGKWFIRAGNIICLAELIWWSREDLTMFELYRLWLGLLIQAQAVARSLWRGGRGQSKPSGDGQGPSRHLRTVALSVRSNLSLWRAMACGASLSLWRAMACAASDALAQDALLGRA